MTLRDLLSRDGAVILQSPHFGEEVTYEPAAGGSYTIQAMIVRRPPDSRPETERARFRVAQVYVRNDADPTLGVALPVVQRDHINLVMEVGQSAVDALVTRVVYGDEMFWQLEVTA